YYAQRALNLSAMITMSLSTVSGTELAWSLHRPEGREAAVKSLEQAASMGLFLSVPLSVFSWIAAEPILAVLFRRGRFAGSSLLVSSECFRWFSISVAPGLILSLFHRACSIMERPWR